MKIKSHSLLCILATIALSSPLSSLSMNAQKAVSKTWNPNLKNGMYRNPVIDADYSDPDVCRVGNDYYMTSSSFQCFPGLQILHSTDLVNWKSSEQPYSMTILYCQSIRAQTWTGARKFSMVTMYGHPLSAIMTDGSISTVAILTRASS